MVDFAKNEVLAIIPARGGSKRFKRKNLYPVLGVPMIKYSLDILRKIEHLSMSLISTEDEEIFNYCCDHGFQTPYRRPMELAEDDSSVIDVILHAVDWYNVEYGLNVKVVLLLQPTSPHRTLEEVLQGLEMFLNDPQKSLTSVQPMLEHPEECIQLSSEGSWRSLAAQDHLVHNSQNYPKDAYFIDGSIYIATVDHLRTNRNFVVPNKTNFLILDRRWPLDIDYVEDIKVAEAIMDNAQGQK